jgi:hypothetical protein
MTLQKERERLVAEFRSSLGPIPDLAALNLRIVYQREICAGWMHDYEECMEGMDRACKTDTALLLWG